MWLCFNDGFLSVVADKNDPTRLMVRARRKGDLLNIFGEDAQVVETRDADYRWRTFIPRTELKAIVNARIDALDYTNFKGSVSDDDRHDMYLRFWSIHRSYQEDDISKQR